MNSLAVIIPMYNEEKHAARCVEAVCGVLSSRLPESKLFAVNDGSTDQTLSILRGLAEKFPALEVVHCEKNGGFGGAVATGMRAAHAKGFVFGLVMDSDLTNDPHLIPQFAAKLSTENFDLIKASRYIPGGGMKGVPKYRQIYSIVGNRIAAMLFNMGIRDCTNGFHAVRLAMVANETFAERGFSFLLEELLILKKKAARATEIPYILTARETEGGVSSFTYRPAVIWAYLKYALRAALV